jgi:hypothetical protein
MTDLMVTLSIMKKHLKRGQHARALNDNNHAIGVSVELLRLVSDEKSHHSALYAADSLTRKCMESKDANLRALATSLQNQFLAPLDQKKIHTLFSISEDLVKRYKPEAYAQMAGALEGYRACVLSECGVVQDNSKQEPRRASLRF